MSSFSQGCYDLETSSGSSKPWCCFSKENDIVESAKISSPSIRFLNVPLSSLSHLKSTEKSFKKERIYSKGNKQRIEPMGCFS